MANETRGILYETITEVALRQAVKLARIPGTVRWNEKPAGMSIKPDFTIGADKDKPTHVVLVTASGSSHDSHKKFWRNLGEMQEVKAQLPGSPTVVNLYFKSEVKANLNTVTQQLYDATLNVDAQPYFPPLEDWVKNNIRNIAKTRDARRELLAHDLKCNQKLAQAVDQLAADLSIALNQQNTELDPLWEIMREDYLRPHRTRSARTTTVRRGLGKLMVLTPEVRKLIYKKLTVIPVKELSPYVFALGFFKKTIGGARLEDSEIKGVIDLLGPEKCEAIINKSPASMSTWINPLRDLERVGVHVDFVYKYYDKIINPEGLKELLIKCYEDPVALSGVPSDEKVWIFEIIISLIKAKSGKKQGYGGAQLAADTQIPELLQGLYGVFMTPFIQRQKNLPEDRLKMLADGLSHRFARDVARSDIPALRQKVVDWVIKENLEDRLIPYRNFEPLLWLLYLELEKQGVEYTAKIPHVGWVGEYTQVGSKSATTLFVRVGNTLIHWKSVSDSGKVHKKKELAARARCIRYQYNTEIKTFTRRQGVEQLALIVDGTFDDSDLKVLSEAGWDLIVYPDEIPDLVSSLK